MIPFKTYRATFSVFVLSSLTASSLAQNNVGLSLSANFNQVNYANAEGVRNNNLKGLPGVAINFIFQSKLHKATDTWKKYIQTSVGYKTGSFKDVGSNLLTTWTVNYATAGIGYLSSKKTKKAVNPFFSGSIFTDYLVSGVQSRGFEQYDLTNDLNRFNFSIGAGSGIDYKISELSHCSLGLFYARGLVNIESGAGQTAKLHGWQLSAMIFFTLAKNKK